MYTISDRRGIVQVYLSNRADLAVKSSTLPSPFNNRPMIDHWLMESYLDLGNNYDFEDMEVGPFFTACAGDNITQYIPFPGDVRAIKQVMISPTFDNRWYPLLGPKNIKVITRTTIVSPGRPSQWARFGYNLWFDRIPDRSYPIMLFYWQKPQIVYDSSLTSQSDVDTTPLLMPDDWLEILDREAELRGWIYLQNNDKINRARTLIYGDPKDPTNPGLIKEKQMCRTAERIDQDYAFDPVRIQCTYGAR